MKLKLWLSILAFAIFIGGAYIAYDQLASQDAGSNLQFVENGKLPAGGQTTVLPPAATPAPETGVPEESVPVTPPAGSVPSEDEPAAGLPSESLPETGNTSGGDWTEKPPEANPIPSPPAPAVSDFTVYDVNGKAVKLSEYFGKPIVLNFFASWCGPCRTEMPAFQAQYLALRSEINFVFVSIDESFADAKKYVNLQGFSFPILHDRSGSAAAAYKVTSIPSSFFINKDGELVAYAVGALSYASLEMAISRIR